MDFTKKHNQPETELPGSGEKAPPAGHIALVGNWAMDIRTGKLDCSDKVFEVFGVAREQFVGDYEAFLERVHPDDRARVDVTTQAALAGKEQMDMEYRAVLPDGSVRYIHALGELSRSGHEPPRYLVGTVLDVTERRRAEERIRLLESVVINANDAVLITEGMPIDPPGPRIIYVNEAFERMTGYSPEEIIGKTPRVLQGPKTDRAALDQMRAALLKRESIQLEVINYRKDGSEFYVEISLVPVTDDSGTLTHFVAIQRDITERRRSEEALRESEERFRTTFEQAPIGICQISIADGTFVRVNSRLCEMFGYSLEELVTLKVSDVTHPDDLEASVALIEELSARKRRFAEIEKRYVRKDGAIVWGHLTVSTLQDGAGELRYLLGVVEDITLRKEAEDTLRFQAHLLDRIGEAVVATDPMGQILYFNRFAEDLFGWQRSQVIGLDIVKLLAPEFRDGQEQEIKTAIDRGESVSGEFTVTRRDESTMPVSFTVTALADAEGKPTAVIGIMADTTERKRAEEALHELSGRLMQAQDEERRRIARELHDSTAQQLVAIAMSLGLVQERLSGRDTASENALADVAALVEQCTREIRTLSHLLYPPLLDEMGLYRALRDYIQRFSRSSGIGVRFEAEEREIGRLSQEVETTLFRVVQESLANVLRHSGSAVAWVHLRSLEDELELEIIDRGRGLPPEMGTMQGGGTFGIGILGMRERLRQLGGSLDIISKDGVTVRAVVPRHRSSS